MPLLTFSATIPPVLIDNDNPAANIYGKWLPYTACYHNYFCLSILIIEYPCEIRNVL